MYGFGVIVGVFVSGEVVSDGYEDNEHLDMLVCSCAVCSHARGMSCERQAGEENCAAGVSRGAFKTV